MATRETIIYHKNGGKTVISGGSRRPSYESTIDMPMNEQVLSAYRQLEKEGKLKGHDATRKYASFVRSVWET